MTIAHWDVEYCLFCAECGTGVVCCFLHGANYIPHELDGVREVEYWRWAMLEDLGR